MGSTRVLLDAGMHPKEEGLASLPDFSELRDLKVDAAVITHCHLDHIGALPVFQRHHPEAEIVMTEATAALGDAMLHNSVNVMLAKRDQHGVKEYPLFSHGEVGTIERRWSYQRMETPRSLGSESLTCRFYEAGHILGAVGALFEQDGAKVFYTGDVHFEDQTLLRGAQFPDGKIDVLIMETTRGAHSRPADYTRQREAQRLGEVITETIAHGGSVLMPVFALGKTQEMLLLLHELHRSGLVPRHAPISIGGLATKMTQITDKLCDRVRRRHHGVRILELKDLIFSQPKRQQRITYAPGRIYALSSGMMTENTASNDFAFQFIDNPRNTLCFVGYADPDSPGGRILSAQPGDPITLHASHAPVELKCRMEAFDFSGHSTREDLVAFAKRVTPSKILLVHGDAPALAWFQAELSAQLPQAEIILPHPGEILRLD
jgi:Cft2 family RNA processing exonuclease